jgi:hypothetical protein
VTGGTSATITGTPTVAGNYNTFTVQVTDAASRTASANGDAISIYNPVAISGSPASFATVGVAYAASFSATGGHTPLTYAIASGSLPGDNWLTLDPSSGLLSGTPAAGDVGTVGPISIKATDVDGRTSSTTTFSIIVSLPVTISGTPATSVIVGSLYSATFSGAGGSGSLTYAIASGSLPGDNWLTLNSGSGLLSGTPAAGDVGTVGPISIKATDNVGRTASTSTFSITVVPTTLAIPNLPGNGADPQTGTLYSVSFAASGGYPPYTYATVAGPTYPPWLSLNTLTGVYSGTPTSTGTSYSGLAVKVTDSHSQTATTHVFAILGVTPISFGAPTATGKVGTAYSSTVAISGGAGTGYVPTVTSGALPPNLTVVFVAGSSIKVSGTPAASGTFSGTITVTDSTGNTGSHAFSIVVSP